MGGIIMESIQKVIEKLRNMENEARHIMENTDNDFAYPEGAGYLLGCLWTARNDLAAICNQMPNIPEPRGDMIVVEVLVPASHIEVSGDVEVHCDPDEYFGSPCERRSIDAIIRDVGVIDGVMPKGWEISSIDEDQLKDLLIERKEVVA
jgi:hypothetical protein